jgi:dienelactone hydrolase
MVVAAVACVFLAAIWPARAQPDIAGLVQSARFSVVGVDGDTQTAIGVWPIPRPHAERWPIVVTFSGMAESREGPGSGYLAWPTKYGLSQAMAALLSPPLTAAAFGGLVRVGHLTALNDELRQRAFHGVFAVGVYTPDLLAAEQREARTQKFADWVADVLIPRVRDVFPVTSAGPDQVGVDGVSLGGAVALEVGCRRPESFSAVGSLQPAIRGRERELAERCASALARHAFSLRLASSDDDPLLPVTRKLSDELRKRRVPHSLVVTPGGHDYAFNRGPGAIELLRFHDRALRREGASGDGVAAQTPK